MSSSSHNVYLIISKKKGLYKTYVGYAKNIKNRDRLLKYLQKNGISSQLHYPYSLNRAGALRGSVKKESLPISEKWAKECLSLPIYPYMKLSDAKKVVKTIKKYFNY